jgi:small subunit ribosomal protein S19e
LAPYDDDWLYTRAASIAYQLYMRGKVGVNTLRKHYSGLKRGTTVTEHTFKSAGKCIRYSLQQLEAAGLVGKMTVEDGQVISKTLTKKGTKDMDRIASKIAKEAKEASKRV